MKIGKELCSPSPGIMRYEFVRAIYFTALHRGACPAAYTPLSSWLHHVLKLQSSPTPCLSSMLSVSGLIEVLRN